MDELYLQNPNVLAFVGDAVYALYTRERIARENAAFKTLQQRSAQAVSAPCQSEAYLKIEPVLSETEKEIFRRGRNHHTNNLPKSATAAQYHAATGLECLFGWLYLTDRKDRINELFDIIFQ